MYVATMAQSGYLPEAEPVEFETALEAWQYLRDERRSHLDATDLPDDATMGNLEDATKWGGVGYLMTESGWVYEVTYVTE